VLPELTRAGYAVFEVSYDPPEAVRGFAQSHHIEYPLLSDAGSRVIRELGILDEDLEAHHALFGVPTRPEQLGVPYPMTFILDKTGRVERKLVEENYRLRYGGHWLLQELVGQAEPVARLETRMTGPLAIVSGRAWLDSPTYFAYQRLGLHLELAIAPGWHLYGPGVPPGYTPLAVSIQSAPEGVRLGRLTWPPPAPFRIQGLDEEFLVYDGTIEVLVPLEFTLPRNSGVVRLEISVTFQTCNSTECLPPNMISLSLEVPEAAAP
jgi:hypothetical protein